MRTSTGVAVLLLGLLAYASAWNIEDADLVHLQVRSGEVATQTVRNNDGVWVPLTVKNTRGSRASEYVLQINFQLNRGNVTDFTGAAYWYDWECFWSGTFQGNSAFAGCWIATAETSIWPRTTPAESDINPGSELFVVSLITAQVLHLETSSGHSYWWNSLFANGDGMQFKIDVPILESDEAQYAGLNRLAPLERGVTRDQPEVISRLSTVQIELLTYADAEMNGLFDQFFYIWDQFVRFCVGGFACYGGGSTGNVIVHGYQQNIESIVIQRQFSLAIGQTGAHYEMTLGYDTFVPYSPPGFGNWHNDERVTGWISRRGQIRYWFQGVDTLGIYLRSAPFTAGNFNTTCQHVQASCTGGNQQYATFDDCMSYISSIPLRTLPVTGLKDLTGQTASCMDWHAALAQHATVHCTHAGSNKISPALNPCQNW